MTRDKRWAAIGLLLMLGFGAPRAAAESREQRQTTWEGLDVVVGHTVRIVMPDGTRIEGKATGVEVDALAMEIHKTTDKTAYPKGKSLVPRATLKAVDIESPTGHWRVVGVGVGGGVGALVAFLAVELGGFHSIHSVEPALISGAIALPVGGYLLGRRADRRTVTYVIGPGKIGEAADAESKRDRNGDAGGAGVGVPRATVGAAGERHTDWAGLSVVVGQRVRVLMPEGARIEGKATGLEMDALAIEVAKSSNRKAYPKGRFLASRATLRAVDVVQSSTKHWRILATGLGGAIGYVAMRGAINSAKASETGAALGLGALGVGLPVTGYLIGNAADRRIVTYVIVP